MVPRHPASHVAHRTHLPRRASSVDANHFRSLQASVDGGLVVIPSDHSTSSSTSDSTVTIPRTLLRASHGFLGLRPIRVKLFSSQQSVNSSVATALTFLTAVTYNSATFPELIDFNAIYDECRMLAIKVHWRPFATVPSSAAITNIIAGAAAIGFDPSAGAPSSLGNIMQESYADGPLTLSCSTVSTIPSCERMRVVAGRVPSLAPITSSDCPGSAWFTVDGATPPTLATFSIYFNALGALGVVSAFYQYELDVEFRLRT
jgi:hypothetical protein